MTEKGYKLSSIERDALREIASMGIGRATTALSNLMGRRIDVTAPRLNIISIRTIPQIMGGAETVATAIFMGIRGDAQGSLGLLFDRDSALILSDLLQGMEVGATKMLGKKDEEILLDTGRILAESSLGAMSDFLDIDLQRGDVGIATDMIKALMETVLIKFAVEGEYALLLEVEFSTPPTRVRGHFFFIFDVATLGKLLENVHKKI